MRFLSARRIEVGPIAQCLATLISFLLDSSRAFVVCFGISVTSYGNRNMYLDALDIIVQVLWRRRMRFPTDAMGSYEKKLARNLWFVLYPLLPISRLGLAGVPCPFMRRLWDFQQIPFLSLDLISTYTSSIVCLFSINLTYWSDRLLVDNFT